MYGTRTLAAGTDDDDSGSVSRPPRGSQLPFIAGSGGIDDFLPADFLAR